MIAKPRSSMNSTSIMKKHSAGGGNKDEKLALRPRLHPYCWSGVWVGGHPIVGMASNVTESSLALVGRQLRRYMAIRHPMPNVGQGIDEASPLTLHPIVDAYLLLVGSVFGITDGVALGPVHARSRKVKVSI